MVRRLLTGALRSAALTASLLAALTPVWGTSTGSGTVPSQAGPGRASQGRASQGRAGQGRAAPAGASLTLFTPGQAWTDQDGNPVQLRGASVLRAGRSWYLFGEDGTGETAAGRRFQDIACYQSADLRHWRYRREALPSQARGDLGLDRTAGQPRVLWSPAADRYLMFVRIGPPASGSAGSPPASGSAGGGRVGLASSATPCGPYRYLNSFRPLGHPSQAIGLFRDANGTGYLLSSGPAGIRVDQLAADDLSPLRTVAILPMHGVPALIFTERRYFLLAGDRYSAARSLDGPWSPARPLFPAGDRCGSSDGTALAVPGPDGGRTARPPGSGTSWIYLGVRPDPANLGTTRQAWLPLTTRGGTLAARCARNWSLSTGRQHRIGNI